MLTFFKEIFTWWNGQTLGTRLQTIFFGKLVGEDELGNKYYQNKKQVELDRLNQMIEQWNS